MKKLDQVLGYLSKDPKRMLRYKRGGKVNFKVFIDASFVLHADHTSRTGIVAMLAGAAVGDWLGKHKLVSKSSSETEVIGLLDRLPHIL